MDISLLLPIIVLLMIVPLFLSSRKQRRVQQEMQRLQSSLEPGDVVSTTSGLRGTVVDASYEDTIDLEIADGVVTTWVRAAIREKITAGDAAPEVEDLPVEPAEPATATAETAPSLRKIDTTAAAPAPSPDEAPVEDKPVVVRENESTNGSARA